MSSYLHGDLRTWSESRKATPQDLDEAERSLNKLKALIGYCRPYDKHCNETLANLEKCLSHIEKASTAPPPTAPTSNDKMVHFDHFDWANNENNFSSLSYLLP